MLIGENQNFVTETPHPRGKKNLLSETNHNFMMGLARQEIRSQDISSDVAHRG